MPSAKPCLGYPSRTAAVLAMLDAGRTHRQIGDAIGIAPATVAALANSGMRANSRTGRRQRLDHRTVVIEVETLNALVRPAIRRNISVAVLVRRLIDTIVAHDMVDAVLDDREEMA